MTPNSPQDNLYSLRRAFMLAAFMLTTCLPLSAKQVTIRQALDIARKYITIDRRSAQNIQTRSSQQPTIEPFYIFNDNKGKGFVVVSGDDAMGEILAYSDNGKLDTLNAHPGVKLLLQAYRESFAWLRQHPQAAKPATRAVPTYKTVQPLLACKSCISTNGPHKGGAKTAIPWPTTTERYMPISASRAMIGPT